MYDQSRLNVTDKRRSNPFSWRGQFTPELIDYLLDTHHKKGTLVADPFSGSGTVLLESIRRNADAVGCEVNPSAYAMSKFLELATRTFPERWNLCQELVRAVPLPGNLMARPVYDANEKDYRKAYSSLIYFAQRAIDSHSNKQELVLLLNILFRMESFNKLNIGQAWNKAYKEITDFLYSLPETASQVSACLADARLIDKYIPHQVGVIITSPPYINVFNYHQNHRIIMELLEFDILDVARSEFGSNRKNRGNRFLTVIQYCLDMGQALSSMQRSCREDGTLIMVVGRESNVRKTPFYNGDIVCDLALNSRLFTLNHRAERVFKNKFGSNIIEDILVFKPSSSVANTEDVARGVAIKHLKKAGLSVANEAKGDLSGALDSIDKVESSPIFHYRSNKCAS
jgi:DNA modification methylase